jgi:prolyl-tRNA synthetase
LKFASESGQEEFAWNTSWGVSTRMVGGLVMTHGDDRGLVMPPLLAPIQVVIVPISRKDDERGQVLEKARSVAAALEGIRVHVDERENLTAGAKFYEWEMKGVPFRIEVGPKDIEKQQLVLVRRVVAEGQERKQFLPESGVLTGMMDRLTEYQTWLLDGSRRRQEANTTRGVDSYERLSEIIENDGGFVFTGWCGGANCETKVKEETKATIRVIPDEEFRSAAAPATCVVCGSPSQSEVVWARAY